ncbi:hypothetical protein J1N35_014321, partial [Gossypium stocksii]
LLKVWLYVDDDMDIVSGGNTITWKLEFFRYFVVLERYCDSNWVTDKVSSTNGYVFFFYGATISL